MPHDCARPWIAASALLLALSVAPSGPARAQNGAGPVWAFDPGEPGPDRPPVGRSLFDRVFAEERDGSTVVDVPYPFMALRRHLLERMGDEAEEAEVLAQVLIPHGRALQRDAAAPDHFASPRLVLAVVGAPPAQAPGFHGPGTRLRNRLYIGYQEKARSLEVISYNEAAGRFEFQVVEDYGPGGTPRAVYARRQVCVSCHQNGAPIFSQPPWDETNANGEVARRLAERAPAFHGVAAEDGSRPFDQALLISTAVVEANLASASQRVWREGCGAATSPIDCRAALLTATLQFKLSGGRHFDTRGDSIRAAAQALADAWAEAWPSGLAIPKALIPNRNPQSDGREVTALFDPLRARPPLEVWPGPESAVLQDVVAGLAQFLSASDAARLDERLRALAGDAEPPRERLRAPCAVSHRSLQGVGARYLVRCETVGADGLVLNGHFYDRSQGRLEGGITWLTIGENGDEVRFDELAIAADGLDIEDGGATVSFDPRNRRDGFTPRLPDGRAVETIALTWADVIEDTADPSAEIPDHPANGEVVLTLVQDFTPVKDAVEALASQASQSGPGVLSEAAFHGSRVMAAVLSALGARADCCADPAPSTPLAIQHVGSTSNAGVDRAFADHCAACHATDSPFPPNFLHDGTRDSDGSGIARCAERIAVRLAMWDRPEGARPTSPMPPEPWLAGAGWSPEAWRESAPLAKLRDHLAGLMALAGTSLQEAEASGWGDYETLPPCLEQAAPDRLE